jgi:hypothetical protein
MKLTGLYKYHRRSIRLKDWDYNSGGSYLLHYSFIGRKVFSEKLKMNE